MAIRTKRLSEYEVTVAVISGTVTPQELEADIQGIDAAAAAPRWIGYFDPNFDMSGVDIAFIPTLRRLLSAKLKEIHGRQAVVAALVSRSRANDVFLRFWPSYIGHDHEYPSQSSAFASVEAACAWFGLADGACEAVRQTIWRLEAATPGAGDGAGPPTPPPG
jgi:hypothetical protein